MIKYLFLILIIGALHANAQLSLERQVVSCFALNISNSDTTLCSTGGQPVVKTINTLQSHLTQGFEQPRDWNPLIASWITYYNECNGLYDVHITSIEGCAVMDSVQIFWNGIPGDSSQTGLTNLSTLHIEGPGGCNASYILNFDLLDVIEMPCDLVFYNFISPNGDSSNDAWIIENINNEYYAINEVKLYNRWGTLVWNIKNYNNTDRLWKGESNTGQALPDGTYFYELIINGNTRTGFVELSR